MRSTEEVFPRWDNARPWVVLAWREDLEPGRKLASGKSAWVHMTETFDTEDSEVEAELEGYRKLLPRSYSGAQTAEAIQAESDKLIRGERDRWARHRLEVLPQLPNWKELSLRAERTGENQIRFSIFITRQRAIAVGWLRPPNETDRGTTTHDSARPPGPPPV